MTDDEMLKWLKGHEGYRAFPFLDSTGHVTVGYGRNIDDVGISINEAEFLLHNDFIRARAGLEKFDWFNIQPDNVQDALVNMCFNMGIKKLLTFNKMITAIINQDYTKAAMEALNSKWATQVGTRATDVALMIREAK